ncbi:hypothetical protein HMPREF9071_0230 [Capnocytophaga sp. oral taxon 338 str. F0234]|nr:hypothetical protein HMPREF9071_0230 [Capnocytophaga sp. oral taxon 338 str. F0234]
MDGEEVVCKGSLFFWTISTDSAGGNIKFLYHKFLFHSACKIRSYFVPS